jgi:hypothetical protein
LFGGRVTDSCTSKEGKSRTNTLLGSNAYCAALHSCKRLRYEQTQTRTAVLDVCPRRRLTESSKELLLLTYRHTTTRVFDFDPEVGFGAVTPPWFIQYICS